jgi:hypothetical protein
VAARIVRTVIEIENVKTNRSEIDVAPTDFNGDFSLTVPLLTVARPLMIPYRKSMTML